MLQIVEQIENTTISYGGAIVREIFSAGSRERLFGEEAFLERFLSHIEGLILDKGLKLLSLDVFDTIVLRNEKCEMRRFLEMGNLFASAINGEFGLDLSPLDAFASRILATQLSYRISPPVKGCREGALIEIHEGICRLSGIPTDFAEKTIALELAYEMSNMAANPFILPLLELAERHRIPVVLISDMYMSGKHIASLLDHFFPDVFDPELIYSSGDLKISKRSGLLFDHVIQEFQIKPSEALHLGDSVQSDFVSAERHGWNALYLPHTDDEIRILEEDEQLLRTELTNNAFSLDALIANHG